MALSLRIRNSIVLVWLHDQALATFCQEGTESVEDLLFSYKTSSNSWKHVLSWLRDNNVLVGTIDESELILGKFNIVNDFFHFDQSHSAIR